MKICVETVNIADMFEIRIRKRIKENRCKSLGRISHKVTEDSLDKYVPIYEIISNLIQFMHISSDNNTSQKPYTKKLVLKKKKLAIHMS